MEQQGAGPGRERADHLHRLGIDPVDTRAIVGAVQAALPADRYARAWLSGSEASREPALAMALSVCERCVGA